MEGCGSFSLFVSLTPAIPQFQRRGMDDDDDEDEDVGGDDSDDDD